MWKHRVLDNVVYGGTALPVPGHLNFGQFMLDRLREHAQDENKVGLISVESGVKTTFREILQNVVDTAAGLRRLGVRRGDMVGVCSENRLEMLAASLAAICCGATVTTANLLYSKDEHIHVFKISQPTVLFASELALQVNLDVWKKVPSLKKIIQLNGTPVAKSVIPYSSILVATDANSFQATEVDGWKDIAMVLYSSGTTGLPKGVMLSHLNNLYAAANFADDESRRPLTEDLNERLLTIVPWFHAYGLMSTMNYLAIGKLLVYLSSFDPQQYLNAIQEYKINVLILVPPLVVFLGKSPLVLEYDVSSVRSMWCGAAPLSAETIQQAMARFPNCNGIFQAYGMTETSLAATQDLDLENVTPKVGSGGVPIRGTKVKIVDLDTGRKLGPNQKGEICIKGPIIMKGYSGNKSATKEIMDSEGYLKTGDIGYYDQDGYFFIVDRLKELIKYKASQVPPAAVENVLLQHSAVAECGVVGRPDEQAGELPTAFVVLKPGAAATDKELIEFSNGLLSPEKRLYGGVIFVDEIPKNASGKILRRVLKQQLIKTKKSKL